MQQPCFSDRRIGTHATFSDHSLQPLVTGEVPRSPSGGADAPRDVLAFSASCASLSATSRSFCPTLASRSATAFARLESEGRLLNSVLKGATHQPGRFGFRGDIALKFQAKLADEARPPEVSAEQVIATAQAGEAHLGFVAGFSERLAKDLVLLGEQVTVGGRPK